MRHQIDSEAGDHRLPFPLEQDSAELGAAGGEIVGPFDEQARGMARGDLVKRDRRDQGKCRGGRIARPEPDQGAGVKIAGRGDPEPALPALAGNLALRPQPDSFRRAVLRQCGDVVVGRAGRGQRADQNKEDAASSVA
jgi:hypothetical protein